MSYLPLNKRAFCSPTGIRVYFFSGKYLGASKDTGAISSMKKLISLITKADNQSHFVEEPLSYKKIYPQWNLNVSKPFKITQGELVIWETTGKFEPKWSNAPRKQFMVFLSGVVEIEVGSGEKRQFKKGDILYVADCDGQGHISRFLEPMIAVVISSDDSP